MKPTPPDDAYGRVTDPERYRPLHRLADELLDRLTRAHAVERVEGASVDGAFSEEITVSGWLSYRFAESSAGRQRLSKGDPARSAPGRRNWPPWPPAG